MPTPSAAPATSGFITRRVHGERLRRGAALLAVGLLTLATAGCSHTRTNAANLAAPARPTLVKVAIPKADRFTPQSPP
jgi:hypothetical protein